MNENIAKALVAAQAEMPIVPMNSINPFFKKKYANLGDVIDTVRPVLKKHGLAFSQLVVGEGGEVGVKTMLVHDSGEFIESTVSLPVEGKSLSQEAGKTITYLRRYSLSAILGIYADEDNDGNSPKASKAKVAPKKATPSNDLTFFSEIATSDDPPRFYKDLPIEDLANRVNGLNKYLKREDLEQDIRDRAEQKRDAAKFFIEKKKEIR